ncbi:MAG: tetratricopeptide repeat protein [Candidatus Zixiibacteriota bacterium]
MISKAMKRRILPKGACSFFLLFMLVSPVPGGLVFCQTLEDAVRYFQAGRLDEAKRILLDSADELADEPAVLFYLGRVEERGDLSRRYLESVADRCPGWLRSAEAGLLVCKYEFCRGMNLNTIEQAGKFGETFAQSEAAPELLWISGCSFLAMGQADSALLEFEQILRSFPGSSWAQWAQLGKGDCFFAGENYDQAIAQYNRVVHDYKYSEAFPFALSGLASSFPRLKHPEEALLYQNLLKEKYPRSPEFVQNPAETERPTRGAQAERLAGMKYTIQLGVFGEKQNALKLRSQFQKQGYSVRVKSKIMGGKEYRSVQLGSFVSYQEAVKLKKKLESQTGESYRIVIQ